jgi:hypothetical protein
MFIFSETSDKVSRVGGDFKETLRVSGGLDNIFDVMIDCHSTLEVRSCLCFVHFVNVFYGKLSFGKSLHKQHCHCYSVTMLKDGCMLCNMYILSSDMLESVH